MSLCEWYANRAVLLTGATSELGRALLEKILRSLPNVTVYVLLRSRAGLTQAIERESVIYKEDRLKKIFASPRYERLKQEVPGAISRVKTVDGNLVCEDLRLNATEKALLREVSVVFHAGGPHEGVLEYCENLPKLKCFVIASSIFKHHGQINETLQNEKLPNLPIAMVHLALIGPSHVEPMPGFVDVLRESTAFMVGAGFAYGKSELQAEIIPLDIAVNTMIAAAWDVGTSNAAEPAVYNAMTLDCTWGDLIKKSRRASWAYPYPTFGIRGMTSIEPLYWIVVLLLEWLPSALCDTVLTLSGKKPRFLAEYDRVRNALQSLKSISSRPWPAKRNRVYLLQERLASVKEQDAFPVTAEIDIEAYVLCAAAASRKHCVKEDNFTFVNVTRLFFLFMPPILVVAYILFVIFNTNKVR